MPTPPKVHPFLYIPGCTRPLADVLMDPRPKHHFIAQRAGEWKGEPAFQSVCVHCGSTLNALRVIDPANDPTHVPCPVAPINEVRIA